MTVRRRTLSAIVIAFATSLVWGEKSTAFQSALKLKVYRRSAPGLSDRLLGSTPHRPGPIKIPAGAFWYVQPVEDLSIPRMKRLAAEVRRKKIPGLDLSDHWELTPSHLACLRDVGRLRMLILTRTPVNDRGLAAVAHMQGLTLLAVGERTTDAGAKPIAKLARLRDLNLDRTAITDAGLRHLTALHALERLDLSGTAVSDEGLALLAKFPHLRVLVLGGRATDRAGEALAQLKSLEELDFSQTTLTEKGLAALSKLGRLRAVTANRSSTDRSLAPLAAIRSLRSLDLSRTQVTDAGLRALSSHPALEELALTESAITDAAMPALAAIPHLRLLEVSDSRVTSAGLLAFAKSGALQAVSFSGTALERRDIEVLSHLTQVKSILFNGVVLPDTIVRQMKALSAEPVAVVKPRPSTPPPTPVPAMVDHGPFPKTAFSAPRLPTTELTAPRVAEPDKTIPHPRADREDQILQAIALHSKTVKRGPTPQLADLRQAIRTDDIISAQESPGIDLQDDKPEAFLGEIQVEAAPRRKP